MASASFLPVLNSTCELTEFSVIFYVDLLHMLFLNSGTFDLLVYTDKNSEIPEGWSESGPCFVPKSHHVQLRSFSTRVHKVDSIVTYRLK